MKAMLLDNTAGIESCPLALSEVPEPSPEGNEVRVKVSCSRNLPDGFAHYRRRFADDQAAGDSGASDRRRRGSGWTGLQDAEGGDAGWDRVAAVYVRGVPILHERAGEFVRVFTIYGLPRGRRVCGVCGGAGGLCVRDSRRLRRCACRPLLCAGIIGYRAMKRCNLSSPGSKLGIFGYGSSAHIVMQLARHRGYEVYVVTRKESHQKLAQEMGAAWVGRIRAICRCDWRGRLCFAGGSGGAAGAAGAGWRWDGFAGGDSHVADPAVDYQLHLFRERDIHPVTANTRRWAASLSRSRWPRG